MQPGQVTVGHPVDVASGIVDSSSVDITVNGRLPLTWERTYLTPAPGQAPGPVGVGWSTRYHTTLTRQSAGYELRAGDNDFILIADRDGTVERGGVARNLTTAHEIAKDGNDYVVTSWDIETYDITRYRFAGGAASGVWRLASIDDGRGNALQVAYDRAGRVYSIAQARHRRALRLEYGESGQIQRVHLVLPSGRSRRMVEYAHDGRGRLVSAVDAIGRTARYDYDAASRLVREVALCGEEYVFRYDDRGRCIETSGRDGFDRKTLRFADQQRFTELRDSRGHAWRYHWNPVGQVVAAISPRGAVEATTYDEHGRVVGTIDALGRKTEFAFDDQGNRVALKYPNGSTTTARFESHRLVSITDPLGAKWEYGYDQKTGWLTEVLFPTGLRATRHLAPNGDLLLEENSGGGRWQYSYDEFGQLAAITDWAGGRCRYAYDETGNVSELVDAEGNATRYSHDANGGVTDVRYADGATREITYGPGGEVVKVVESGSRTITFEYGPGCSQVRRVTGPGSLSTAYVWGTEPSQLQAVIDAKGERHTFTYDEDGYLVKEQYPNGRTITYVRDLCGFVRERINGAGETTTYERDTVGRIVHVTFHDGSEATLAYDAIGMVVKAVNEHATVEIERNKAGDRIKETIEGFTVESEYDVLCNRVARKSSLGARTTYHHDPRGRIVRMELSPSDVISRQLDKRGREVVRQFGSLEMVSRYDPMDRLAERWTGAAIPQGTTTNAEDRPKARLSSHRQFKYDPFGGLTEIADDLWGRTSYQHDEAGHVTEVRSGASTTERYRYDENENVEFAEVVASPSPQSASRISTTSRRDIEASNQIVREDGTRYEYDGDGRLIRKIEDGAGGRQNVWAFSWNPMGLLASVVTPSGETWKYTYDAFGRRIRKEGPDATVSYWWDGNSIIHEESSDAKRPLTTWTFWPENFEPVAKQERNRTYYAVTDHIGTPREYVTADGTRVWSAKFTIWGEVDALTASEEAFPVRYQGQWLDPESGFHQNGLRHYAPRLAAFISMDPVPLAGGPNGYLYAPDPLHYIDPHGLAVTPNPLDSQGRPTGASGTLTRANLRPTDSSPPTIDPPGWQGGTHPHHQQRSHVVADTLGGSGSDVRNIVALTDGANHPGMSTIEGKVRRHIQRNGGPVHYEVTVNYRNNHKTPSSVQIRATDKNGKVIVDEKVVNGRRQKTACCP